MSPGKHTASSQTVGFSQDNHMGFIWWNMSICNEDVVTPEPLLYLSMWRILKQSSQGNVGCSSSLDKNSYLNFSELLSKSSCFFSSTYKEAQAFYPYSKYLEHMKRRIFAWITTPADNFGSRNFFPALSLSFHTPFSTIIFTEKFWMICAWISSKSGDPSSTPFC